MKFKKYLSRGVCMTLLASLFSSGAALAQSTGENLDFSNAPSSTDLSQSFLNWQGEYGTWSSSGLSTMYPGFTNPGSAPGAGGGSYPILGTPEIKTGGNDPFVSALSMVPPYVPGTNSAKLGDSDHLWAEVNRLTYDLTVTPENSFFYYDYAAVFLDPSDEDPDSPPHADNERPRFSATLRNSSGNTIGDYPCGEYEVISGVNNAYNGFNETLYTFNGESATLLWKDWTRVGMDLTNYIGQTITVVFESRDCALGGHFGYAYVSAGVFGSVVDVDACEGSSIIELPLGFEEYNWSTGGTTHIETIGFGTAGDVTCGIVSENGCTLDFVVDINNDFSDVTEVNNVYCTNTLDLSNCFSEDTTASFAWSPDVNISSITDSVVTVQATPDLYNTSQSYNLTTTIAGQEYESTYIINFNGDLLTAGNPVTLDCGETAELGPCGPMDGASYSWTPTLGLSDSNIANPIVSEVIGNYPSQDYILTILHEGNTYIDTVSVNFSESIFEAGPPVSLECGESALIGPCAEIPGATYNWVALNNTPSDYNIDDPTLVNPTVYIGATANMETVYEMTITLADGTQVVDSVTVSLASDPANLGANILSVCGPIDLEPCTILKGAFYEWSPPEGLSNTEGPTTTVTPYLGMTYPAEYNLMITEIDGTIHNGSVWVDYEPPTSEIIDLTIVPDSIDGNINNCDRIPQGFTAFGGPSDMTYTWEIISQSPTPETDIYEFMENDFVGADPNGSEVSIQFYDFSEEFVILKVTGTSASEPCFVGEGIIIIHYCCFRPDMLKMEGDYYTSSLVDSLTAFSSINIGIGGYISITDQYILIDGTLHIDQNTSWIECEVKFEEDARIIVDNNISFQVRDSYLSACSEMWDGIYVLDQSSYLLMAEDTVFDAHQAVVSKNGGQLYVENTDFTDNNKSIVIRDFAPSPAFPFHPSTIESCKFLVDSMHSPLSGEIPFVGIEIENVEKYTYNEDSELDIFSLPVPLSISDFYIIGTGSDPAENYFIGLENGINMINTKSSQIRHNEFLNCETGIRVQNSESDLFHSNAFIGDPTEYNQGMRMDNIEDDKVYLSYFRDMNGGIVAANDPSYWMTGYEIPHLISGTTELGYKNYFTGKGTAHRTNYLRVQAEGNDIFQSTSRFINVKRGSKIRYNKIQNIGGGNTAIQVQNYMPMPYGNDVDVVDNTIGIDNHGSGIWISSLNSFNNADLLEDSDNANHQVAVVDNNITMNNMDNEISYGIRIENSSNIIAGFNTVENSGNLNLPAQRYNLRGLSLAQTQEARIISNTFTKMSLGLRGIGDLLGSIYECNAFQLNYHGMYFEGSLANPGGVVFTYISQQGDPGANPQTISYPHNNEWYDAGYPGQSRIGGSADNAPYVNWYWNEDNPAIYEHNEIIGILESSLILGQIQCDAAAPSEWTDEVNYDLLLSIANESNTYQAMQAEAQYYDNHFAYRVLRENPGIRNPETANGLVLHNFYELLDNSNLREFYDIIQHVKAGELEDALTKNAAVLSDLLIEQNQKQVNSIYINQLINGVENYTDDEKALLESIAYLTPYLGGDAVYTARAMLDIDPDDLGVAYRQASIAASNISQIQLYPNPSSGKLTLTFDTPSDKNCIFECYDVQAKLLKTVNLDAFKATHHIDLSDVSAGLYFVRVIQGDEILLNEKLILTK